MSACGKSCKAKGFVLNGKQQSKEFTLAKKYIKVQKPLNGGDDWLIYAEGHENVTQGPPTDDLRRAMGDAYKAFFEGKFENGAWKVGKRVSDRGW
jgi:hypothetical protein